MKAKAEAEMKTAVKVKAEAAAGDAKVKRADKEGQDQGESGDQAQEPMTFFTTIDDPHQKETARHICGLMKTSPRLDVPIYTRRALPNAALARSAALAAVGAGASPSAEAQGSTWVVCAGWMQCADVTLVAEMDWAPSMRQLSTVCPIVVRLGPGGIGSLSNRHLRTLDFGFIYHLVGKGWVH